MSISFPGISNLFPRIRQSVLSDWNSFPWIRQPVLSDCNSFPSLNLTIRSLGLQFVPLNLKSGLSDLFPRFRQFVLLSISRERIAIRLNEFCQSRERLAIREKDCLIWGNGLHNSIKRFNYGFIFKIPCPFRALTNLLPRTICPLTDYPIPTSTPINYKLFTGIV